MIDANTEIRKLRPAELYALAQTLSLDSWKILMSVIPTSNNDSTPEFTSEHVRMIKCAAEKQHRNPAEVFLDEWGTWGRNRPTVKSMMNLCIQHELFRTADFLVVQILKQTPPKRPHMGPAAPVEIPEDFINHLNMNVNESEPDNINAAFCHQITAEANDTQVDTEISSIPFDELMDLQQFNVPTKNENVENSSDSKQFDAALDEHGVGVIEVNYSELPEKYAKDYGIDDKNFNHEKFTRFIEINSSNHNKDSNNELLEGKLINQSNSNNNDSTKTNKNDKMSENLMKFSIVDRKEIEYGLEQSSSLLPNFEIFKSKRSIEDGPPNNRASQKSVSYLPNLDELKFKNSMKELPKIDGILQKKPVTHSSYSSPSSLPNLEILKLKNSVEKLPENDETVSHQPSDLFLPNLEALKLSNSVDKLPYFLPEELQSSELPLCIKSVIGKKSVLDNWSESRTKMDSLSIETPQGSSMNTSDDSNDDLTSGNVPQGLLEYNKNQFSGDEKTFNEEENFNPVNINSQELPLTVLEFSKR